MTNKPKIIVDHFSTSTVPIEMFFGDTSLSTASAFLYEFEHQTYLVTNWHNLSGRSPESGEPVSPTCGLPDRISFALPTVENVAAWKIVSTHLFEQFNDSRVARWYEHPDSGSTVDIGVLPLDAIPGLKLNAINNFIQNKQLPITVAAEVFVLGYPKRLNSGGAFPIWKRASIASEPQLDLDGLPMFLIDTATRQGMSGSPVILRNARPYRNDKGEMEIPPALASRFLGIYSGRLGDNEYEAQLGLVWKERAILETIKAKKPASISI